MTYPQHDPGPPDPRPGPQYPGPQGAPGPAYPGFAVAQLAPSGQPLADFGQRLLARLVDTAVMMGIALVTIVPVFLVVAFAAQDTFEVAADGTVSDTGFGGFVLAVLGLTLGILVIAFGAGYLYEVELTLRTGQTWGKRAMKIKVVPLHPQPGTEPFGLTRRLAVRRWLAYSVAGGIIPYFAMIDGLWQLWDKPWRQCLHDKFADTVVVRCDPAGMP